MQSSHLLKVFSMALNRCWRPFFCVFSDSDFNSYLQISVTGSSKIDRKIGKVRAIFVEELSKLNKLTFQMGRRRKFA